LYGEVVGRMSVLFSLHTVEPLWWAAAEIYPIEKGRQGGTAFEKLRRIVRGCTLSHTFNPESNQYRDPASNQYRDPESAS
jgi:hypothetical protein